MADIRKGLVGVVVDTTAVSKVNPDTNSLLYRGYPVQELAASCSVEQVAWLLWHGELPTDDELVAFEADERTQREVPAPARPVIHGLRTTAQPMDVVRTAVGALGATDPADDDASPDANRAKAVRLFA